MTYTIDDKIGRHDSRDTVYISLATISGVASILPSPSLGRRNFIRVKNLDDTASVYLLANESDEYAANGYEIAHGDEWEENTDAPLYITTASGLVNVQVYERSTRFNYKS